MVTAGSQTVVVPASAVTVPTSSTMAVGSAAATPVAVTTATAAVVTANNVQTVQTTPAVGTVRHLFSLLWALRGKGGHYSFHSCSLVILTLL